jgi:hypothetical protein
MNPAMILFDWFLRAIGEARATELLLEEKTQRTLVRRQRKAAARQLRRQRAARKELSEPSEPSPGLAQLRAKGWTLRPAAKVLGVTATHLHQVLLGARQSRSLSARVAALPRKTA